MATLEHAEMLPIPVTGLPHVSPDVVLGNENSTRALAKAKAKRAGRLLTHFHFANPFSEVAQIELRGPGAYGEMADKISDFNGYWEDYLKQNGKDLKGGGVRGKLKIKDGTKISFHGASFEGRSYVDPDGSRGSFDGTEWNFFVTNGNGRRTDIQLISSQPANEVDKEAEAESFNISFSKNGMLPLQPLECYVPSERLEGYETVAQVMGLIQHSHEANAGFVDVEGMEEPALDPRVNIAL